MEPFIGVISDTHGLLRPPALAALKGSQLIIHAGDVGEASILEQLGAIAPVHAVRGNVDHGRSGLALPATAQLEIGDVWFYVLHILEELDLDARAGGLSGGGPVQLGEVSSKRGKRDRGLRARGGKAAKLAERLAGVAAADFVDEIFDRDLRTVADDRVDILWADAPPSRRE